MSSKIEQLINDIEDYIDGCKYQSFSNTKIIVNKEEIEDLLEALRTTTPEEIKYYRKIIKNKEAILNDAREKAEGLINKATIQTNELISEHEIMQQAYAQANEIVKIATEQAADIRDKAIVEGNEYRQASVGYMDNFLVELQTILESSINTTSMHYESLVTSLNDHYSTVINNRKELYPPEEPLTDIPDTEDDYPLSGDEIDII